MTTRRPYLVLVLVLVVLAPSAWTNDAMSFDDPIILSLEDALAPGGAVPGEHATDVALTRLFQTDGGVLDGRLVAVYADANTTGLVWSPQEGAHMARDIFMRSSDDDGATWSNPVNLSNTARLSSARCDCDGDGYEEIYWGDSATPHIFSSGDVIAVSWCDKYCPEEGWTFGQIGQSSVQGRVLYPDIPTFPYQHHVPFSGVWLAASIDGGETWMHGAGAPPLQLTFGRRDAIQDAVHGDAARWVVTWQEDPLGLQPGMADGPDDATSGAIVSEGTDIWYAYTPNIAHQSGMLCSARAPLSNHSRYDLTTVSGFATQGEPGAEELRGASRASVQIMRTARLPLGTLARPGVGAAGGASQPGVPMLPIIPGMSPGGTPIAADDAVFLAVVAYEESEGTLPGKVIRYHCFPFEAPGFDGPPTERCGTQGTVISDAFEHARDPLLAQQASDGSWPAVAVLWRQGLGHDGDPADVMLKLSKSFDPIDLAATPALNISTNSPSAAMFDLGKATYFDPLEDARNHSIFMRGELIVVGWTWTWNGPLARYTDLANHDVWIRRSVDGGATWFPPQNVFGLTDTSINATEPRIVGTPRTGWQDDAVFVVTTGTETNVYEGVEDSVPLDILATRTRNSGASFEAVVPIADTTAAESGAQVRISDRGARVFAVWNEDDGSGIDALFAGSETPPWVDLGHALAGAVGEPFLGGVGPLTPLSMNTIGLASACPNAMAILFLSTEATPTPFRGGFLVPVPWVADFTVTVGDGGALAFDFVLPDVLPPDGAFYTQFAILDRDAPKGVALSNALQGTFQ